jgi:hypothetical protein
VVELGEGIKPGIVEVVNGLQMQWEVKVVVNFRGRVVKQRVVLLVGQ